MAYLNGDRSFEQYGQPRIIMVNEKEQTVDGKNKYGEDWRAVDTDRYSTVFLKHTHDEIHMELPEGRGGKYPMRDLEIRLWHTDTCNKKDGVCTVHEKVPKWFLDNDDGLVDNTTHYMTYSKGQFKTTTRVTDIITMKEENEFFNYQIPSYHSITNLHNDPELYWKRLDGGSTDGYYAVLEGANFGEGCGNKNGGSCLNSDEKYPNKFTGAFAFTDPKLMGILRYMKMTYDRNDNKMYEMFELDASTMAEKTRDGLLQDEFVPEQRTRLCTCSQMHGPEGVNGKGCDQFDADAYCSPIKTWNHTHITFWVDSGIGHRLPLQIETGGQNEP